MKVKKSNFIVIEGLDGAGKTSAMSLVKNILQEEAIYDVILTREPGGTPLAESLRTLIKNSRSNERFTNYAELLMFYAARVQLVEVVIKPSLARGTWVISDRHDLSSQAYQGGGRGVDRYLLQTLRDTILGNFFPDLTFYLDITPELSLARSRSSGTLHRIELESLEFFDRTRTRYKELAAENVRIITIDASQPITLVNNDIRKKLIEWLRTQV